VAKRYFAMMFRARAGASGTLGERMLRIQITKKPDGGGVLRCIREDGSVTWQTQPERHAAFFALHDLTHFAVESALAFEHGFFGLIAQGWEIDDTTGKGARGSLPAEAGAVEYIVGAVFSEGSGGAVTADEFNEFAAIHATSGGQPAPRRLTDQDLERVRRLRTELFRKWRAVAPGETLELSFQPAHEVRPA
jgi:hypothetical protein